MLFKFKFKIGTHYSTINTASIAISSHFVPRIDGKICHSNPPKKNI